MAKAGMQPGVWTIAWGVFWGMMLWSIFTGVIVFVLWASSCAALMAGAAAANRATQPAPRSAR